MTEQHIHPTPASLPAGSWQLDVAATTVTVSAKKLLLWTIPATSTSPGPTSWMLRLTRPSRSGPVRSLAVSATATRAA